MLLPNPAATAQRRLLLLAAAALPLAAQGQVASPHAIDIPRWFALSLLDFKDEVAEAARAGKRVMVYFGQDGCPYCKALMKALAPGPLADKTKANFVAVAINIWGDAEVTWLDGRRYTEKTLAKALQVQFTPTLLFLDSDARVALRLDGYLAPERLSMALDYVIARRDKVESLAEYFDARDPTPPLPPRAAPKYLLRDPSQLARRGSARPLAVLFESPKCRSCAEMHDEAFKRSGMVALLKRFDVARIVPGTPASLVTPDGRRLEAGVWARELRIRLYPSVVFFDTAGREVFRFDGYLRPFHIESSFDYVASGAYLKEPMFQRYVQARAEALRDNGKPIDLWR